MSTAANSRVPNNPPSDPPSEPTGPVTKDSLANESIKSGGGFADNENPEVLGVKGYQSTLTNTDTTNADTLEPAPSASVRDQTKDEITKYPDADASQKYSGTTSDQGYVGGPSNVASVQPDVDSAPSYVTTATGNAETAGELKPKGDNLVENEGIPEDHETKVRPIGGKNDPGRLAELKFQTQGADASGGLGARDYGEVTKNTGAYDALDNSEQA